MLMKRYIIFFVLLVVTCQYVFELAFAKDSLDCPEIPSPNNSLIAKYNVTGVKFYGKSFVKVETNGSKANIIGCYKRKSAMKGSDIGIIYFENNKLKWKEASGHTWELKPDIENHTLISKYRENFYLIYSFENVKPKLNTVTILKNIEKYGNKLDNKTLADYYKYLIKELRGGKIPIDNPHLTAQFLSKSLTYSDDNNKKINVPYIPQNIIGSKQTAESVLSLLKKVQQYPEEYPSIARRGKIKKFPKNLDDIPDNFARIIFLLEQVSLDYLYSPKMLSKLVDYVEGIIFNSHIYYPGKVNSGVAYDDTPYTVFIDAKY